MTDVSGPPSDTTVGHLLAERIRLTRSRRDRGPRLVHHWVQNINAALDAVRPSERTIGTVTPMSSLSALEAAAVLVAAALAEGTPVIAIDHPDDFAATDGLLAVAAIMAPPRVTIIAGAAGHPSDGLVAGRPVITIDVDAVDRREVLQ